MPRRAEPQVLETWRKYEKGLCDDCWAGCCTMPVEAKSSDLVRLGLMSETEVEWGHEDQVAARLMKRKLVQFYSAKSKTFVLAQVSGRDCVYLHPKSRQCTVYEKRPDTCRNFPRVGPRSGFCPYGSRDE